VPWLNLSQWVIVATPRSVANAVTDKNPVRTAFHLGSRRTRTKK